MKHNATRPSQLSSNQLSLRRQPSHTHNLYILIYISLYVGQFKSGVFGGVSAPSIDVGSFVLVKLLEDVVDDVVGGDAGREIGAPTPLFGVFLRRLQPQHGRLRPGAHVSFVGALEGIALHGGSRRTDARRRGCLLLLVMLLLRMLRWVFRRRGHRGRGGGSDVGGGGDDVGGRRGNS